jgi:hypothetical protein
MQLEELSNISDNLAMMPDPALQQFAQMHKEDPYMVSLALSESNRRKKVRTAAQGQAAGMPQPKVVDAAIQGMAPAPAPAPAPMMAQQQLPENQGIGALPAPNMQGMADGGIAGYDDDMMQSAEPVIRMSGGGYVPSFSKTGAVNAAFEAALEKTLKYEGGYVKDDAGKGESNFGINKSANPDVDVKNLTKEKARELYKKRYWDAIGGDALAAKDPALATVAFDTAVNMGVSKASQLIAKSKGDPAALLGMRQQHYDNLIKDNPKKFAPYEKGWKDRVADLATSVIPSAEAGALPKAQAAAPADASSAAQIPGQSVQAPASNYDQTNSFFGRMADKMGIPLEAQRQIGTTLNAPTPLAPVVGSVKSGSSGIASLGEKIGDKLGLLKGPAGRMSKAEIAALKNEQAGLRALENSQQAMKEAQSAGATLDEQEYLRKMIETRRAAEGPSKAAQIAEASQLREAGDVATAQRLAQTGERAQTAGRVDALADRATPAPTPEATPTLGADQRAPVRYDEFGPPNIGPEALDLTKKEMDAVAKDAKQATPVEARKGLTNDDYLMMGLNLLASKAPNFATAFGEAGVATLGAKRAREKDEREEAKLKGSEELQKAQAKYYGAYAGAIERGAKEKNDELEAEKLVRQYMGDWERNNKIANIQDPTARLQEEARIRQQIYTSLGLTSIMPKQAGSASQSDPLGILNKR